MKNNLKTFPYIHGQAFDAMEAKNQWKTDFEKELYEKLQRLGDTSIHSMHDNVHAKLILQGKKEIIEEILGKDKQA
jgi:hypothetical protein